MFDLVPLIETAGKAAGTDARLATDDELFAGVLGIEQARRRLDAAEAHMLAELDARGSTDIVFGLRTPRWLAREACVPKVAAKQRVKVANAMRSTRDQVDEQLTEGRIGAAHARVLTTAVANPRIGHLIADMQADLLAEAQQVPFEIWARHVTTIVSLLDQDGGHDPDADLARNTLHFEDGFDHATRVAGTLIGETAEIVRQGVEARADVLFRHYTEQKRLIPDIEIPTRATLRALALAELVREALGVDLHTTRAPRTDITLVINAGDPETATTPGGVRLADGTTRRLCCDAMFTPVVVDNLGVPLDMGREKRLATDAQRRAAAIRDGGCVFPGCDAPPSWVDMHHIILWDDGGPTDLEVLASLCRRDHGTLHRTGWAMYATDDGWFYLATPTGTTYWCQRHGRTPPGPPPPPPPRPEPPP